VRRAREIDISIATMLARARGRRPARMRDHTENRASREKVRVVAAENFRGSLASSSAAPNAQREPSIITKPGDRPPHDI